jgi:hypothetical protein
MLKRIKAQIIEVLKSRSLEITDEIIRTGMGYVTVMAFDGAGFSIAVTARTGNDDYLISIEDMYIDNDQSVICHDNTSDMIIAQRIGDALDKVIENSEE